ncbi:MAG: hypothetical protein KGH94_04325 [Candidatus Micrarchaeota archaeon]|nr:hypothetical protein [Candidatus Micrarchaeota archaeon]
MEKAFRPMILDIVKQAAKLKDAYTSETGAPVNYACIFAQNQEEYDAFVKAAGEIGKIIDNTPTGPLFRINPLDTVSGKLQLLKVRTPDATRPERGDADFTVSDYPTFKRKYLAKPGFKLIRKDKFEMIELMDSYSFNVRAYFSNPPLDKQLGIT